MKESWQRLALRIDAMTLRERVMIFAAIAAVFLTVVWQGVINPQFNKQKLLSEGLKQDQEKMTLTQAQMQEKVKLQTVDPDGFNREKLKKLQDQSAQMQRALQDMQKGLVAPERMSQLLEIILKRNGKLRLVSLKTLPVASLNDMVADATDAAKTAAAPVPAKSETPGITGAIYKHGVEITLQGSYLDMTNYMKELEAMPWQIFWGKAKLDATEYTKTTLTLTLFTLSLDKKWLNI